MFFKNALKFIGVLTAVSLMLGICSIGVSAAVSASSASVIAEFKSDYSSGNVPQATGVSSADSDGTKVLSQKINSNSQDFCFDITDSNGAVKLNDERVYAVSVTYKVVRIGGDDETAATTINLVRKTASGGELVKIKTFPNSTYYVGDSTDWVTSTVVFKLSIASSPEYNQLGINTVSGSCPSVTSNIEANTTLIQFKEITVTECGANTKSIEFQSNGGSYCETVLAQSGEAITLPTPTRDLYVFKGWYTDAELKTKFTKSTMPNYITYKLYAKWEVSSEAVSIKFNTNSDATLPDIVGRSGDSVTLPKIELDGFRFAGWYDKEYKTKYSFTEIPEKNTALYAKWGVIPRLCNFENTDAFPKPDNAKFTQRCILTGDDKASGKQSVHYSFQRGYELTGSAGKSTPAGVILIDENGEAIRLTAGKTYVISFKYKVVEYKSNGWMTLISASSVGAWADRKQQSGCEMKYDEASLKKGWQSHSFTVTWDPASDSSNYCYFGIAGDSCVYLDDVLVYEKHSKFSYKSGKMMLSFETDDSTVVDTVYGDRGEEITLPVLEKEGYTFLGWTYDEDRLIPVESDTYTLDKVYTLLYADWYKIPEASEVPEETPKDPVDEVPADSAASDAEKPDRVLLYIIIGAVAAVVVAVAVTVAVLVKKRKKT